MYLILLLALLLAAFCTYVAKKPDTFRVMRTSMIKAPPQTVFEQVNDFHRWEAWSPWAKLDPNAKTEFDGPASGTGAIMRWEGNRKVGKGSLTITESRAYELIRMQLDFLKPMKAVNTTEFTFAPQGEHTLVTWSMTGTNNFIGKAMSIIMNCEKMVGAQFEKGLAQIRTIVEK